jgi:hypothetical protein
MTIRKKRNVLLKKINTYIEKYNPNMGFYTYQILKKTVTDEEMEESIDVLFSDFCKAFHKANLLHCIRNGDYK